MGKVEAVAPTQELIDRLKGRYRAVDVEEVRAMSGRKVEEVVDEGWRESELCWIGVCDDGDPFAIFGARRISLLSDEGTPWLLATDRVKEPKVKRIFIEQSVPHIQEMLKRFDYLENFVDARNTTSIKWLKMCGFTIEAPEPAGVLRMPFHRFWLRR